MTATPPVRLILSVLIFAASLLLLCSPSYAQNAGEEESRIASALRDGNPAGALELLAPALRKFPGDAQLWTMQGVAYERQSNKKEALESFTHALKIAPDTIPALEGAAQIEFDGSSPRAIPLLERLLRRRPDDTTSHGMLAVLEFQQGNCSKALPHFEKAIALFQSHSDALHAYAICLVRAKQIEKAATVLEKAVRANPGDTQEVRRLASVELMAHRPEAALAAIQPLLGSSTPDAETLELASLAYEGIHDTERAVDALRQAILAQPANTNFYLDFANMAADHQSFQVGINVVNDGLALQPQSASLYFARGMLYAQLADYERAQADFETAYRLDPSQSLSTAAQGLMAVQQNDLDGALNAVEQKLARKPNDAVLLYLKADILTQQGAETGSARFETAMRSAKRSVALSPTLAPAHAVLAKLYLQSGEYPRAIMECRKSLELNPKDQTSVYRLIQALRKTEHKDEIPALLKRLAKLREEATGEERERYRYKLVEEGTSTP
jgi:tetratricopeptide (TPR) repeat protein